jgi:hypothetical protein
VTDTCLRQVKAIKQSLTVWGSNCPIFPVPNLCGKHGYSFPFHLFGNYVTTLSSLPPVLESHFQLLTSLASSVSHLLQRHAHSAFGFSPVWSTWVQFLQTILTCVWQFTHTLVRVYKVNTGTPILTRVYGTIIHICLTVCSCIARKALTRVCIQMVLAYASMLTGVGPTLINVLFTLFA